MKTSNETSDVHTATTSTNAPAGKSENNVAAPITESAYLAQQAAEAKAALTRALSEIGAGLGQSVSVGKWMKKSPWLMLGASTIAGFVASAAVVPSKEQQALRKLAKIERALRPDPVHTQASHNGNTDHSPQPTRKPLMGSILGEVIKALQPALVSMITAGMAARTAADAATEDRAGQGDAIPADDSSYPSPDSASA